MEILVTANTLTDRDMKANELMTGDWVYSTFCDKPCKVIGIEQYESEYVNVKVTNVTGAKDINSLYFIPLTADILEKNGFTKSNIFIEWKYEEEGIYILWKPFPFLKIETENVQLDLSGCEYVHELQHALRECGIDKEIVL